MTANGSKREVVIPFFSEGRDITVLVDSLEDFPRAPEEAVEVFMGGADQVRERGLVATNPATGETYTFSRDRGKWEYSI